MTSLRFSFTSVPMGGAVPVSYSSSRRRQRVPDTAADSRRVVGGAVVSKAQSRNQSTQFKNDFTQVSQRWLDHYSSNSASIWSSATMNTNLTSSMGRPTAAMPLTMSPMAQRAASQGTLFDVDGAAAARQAAEAPTHSALVIEKGMLKLRPPRQKREGEARDPVLGGAERAREQKERVIQSKVLTKIIF